MESLHYPSDSVVPNPKPQCDASSCLQGMHCFPESSCGPGPCVGSPYLSLGARSGLPWGAGQTVLGVFCSLSSLTASTLPTPRSTRRTTTWTSTTSPAIDRYCHLPVFSASISSHPLSTVPCASIYHIPEVPWLSGDIMRVGQFTLGHFASLNLSFLICKMGPVM